MRSDGLQVPQALNLKNIVDDFGRRSAKAQVCGKMAPITRLNTGLHHKSQSQLAELAGFH